MARRGFFAELERQSRLAAQQREREQRAAVREHNAAVRRAEQAQRAYERAQAQLARAAEADRKRLEKEAHEAHAAAMEAEAAQRNATLAEIYDDVDTLLAATIGVDNYVDLETLRMATEHPPFDGSGLEAPMPAPVPIDYPPEPQLVMPDAPGGIGGLLGGKKRHAEAVEAARTAHAEAVSKWQEDCAAIHQRMIAEHEEHARADAERLVKLAEARERYEAECEEREAATAERHRELDSLIANLGYGVPDAIQEYVAIVLSHSVYPEHFAVSHSFDFDPGSSELALKVTVPAPDQIPDVKAYKYTKTSDTITASKLSQREVKERYTGAVHQVALRSLHEVFEADRRGLIKTITLEVGTNTTDPATGRDSYIPFVSVGAERDMFLEFDLSAVVPAATLALLGAAVSKDPHNLVAAEVSGVRRT